MSENSIPKNTNPKLSRDEYLKMVRESKSELDTLRKYPTRRPAEQRDQEQFNANTTIGEAKGAPDMQILGDDPVGTSKVVSLHPFLLQTVKGDGTKWTIHPTGSSVTQGTLGNNLIIAGLEDERAGAGHVHVQVSVLTGIITGASVVVDAAGKLDELEFNPADPSDQTEANLYLGEVVFEDDKYTFKQATRNAQIIERMFYNGVLCWGFSPHPSHPDSL